jgi:peptide deformylase
MILEILQLGHPLLRQRSREITREELLSPEVQKLIDDLIDTMHAANGAGIAAPQVGQLLRICIAEVQENPRYPTMPALPRRVWVNPVIQVVSEAPRIRMYEGCLSVKGLRGRVTRPARLVVESWDRTGAPQRDEFDGPLAAVAAHECDHLDGVLFVDRAESRTLITLDQFDAFVPQEERVLLLDD